MTPRPGPSEEIPELKDKPSHGIQLVDSQRQIISGSQMSQRPAGVADVTVELKQDGPEKGQTDKQGAKPEGPPAGAPPMPKMINMSEFFRYIHGTDRFLMIVGIMSAVLAGGLIPFVSIAQGEVTNSFDPNNAKEAIFDRMK